MKEARAKAQAEVEAAQAAVLRVEAALEEQTQFLSIAEKEVYYTHPERKTHSAHLSSFELTFVFHFLFTNETVLEIINHQLLRIPTIVHEHTHTHKIKIKNKLINK